MKQFNDFRVLNMLGYSCFASSYLSFVSNVVGRIFTLVLLFSIRKDTMPINTPIPVTPTIATVIIPPNASGESVSSSEKQTYDI